MEFMQGRWLKVKMQSGGVNPGKPALLIFAFPLARGTHSQVIHTPLRTNFFQNFSQKDSLSLTQQQALTGKQMFVGPCFFAADSYKKTLFWILQKKAPLQKSQPSPASWVSTDPRQSATSRSTSSRLWQCDSCARSFRDPGRSLVNGCSLLSIQRTSADSRR